MPMDELSPETKAFLARADSLNSESEQVKQRVRQALQAGLAVSPAILASSSASAHSATGLKATFSSLTGSKLWLSALVLSALGASGWMAWRQEPAPRRADAPHAASETAHEPVPPAQAALGNGAANDASRHPEPALAPVRANDTSAREAAPARGSHHVPSRAEPRASSHPHALGVAGKQSPVAHGELALLTEASDALSSDDAARALSLLAQHRRSYPKPALGEERLALTLIARCMSAEPAARTDARRFVARNADAILTPRVRRACDLGTR
jgi:hypothetical protein